jgi:hypothetical protein
MRFYRCLASQKRSPEAVPVAPIDKIECFIIVIKNIKHRLALIQSNDFYVIFILPHSEFHITHFIFE